MAHHCQASGVPIRRRAVGAAARLVPACYHRLWAEHGGCHLNRSARMHARHQSGCDMTHDSLCTLVSNINTLYTPGTCDGAALALLAVVLLGVRRRRAGS